MEGSSVHQCRSRLLQTTEPLCGWRSESKQPQQLRPHQDTTVFGWTSWSFWNGNQRIPHTENKCVCLRKRNCSFFVCLFWLHKNVHDVCVEIVRNKFPPKNPNGRLVVKIQTLDLVAAVSTYEWCLCWESEEKKPTGKNLGSSWDSNPRPCINFFYIT